MSNMLDDLKKYFAETPREKVLKDWEETKKATRGVRSMHVNEFIAMQEFYHDKLHLPEPKPETKHILRIVPAEEILKDRCNAYQFINFFNNKEINTEQSKGC